MPRRRRRDKRADYGLTREQVDALLTSGEEPPGWNTIFDDDFSKRFTCGSATVTG
jgi:hypothetical protein